ncbi:hypothetical protein BDZ45DRAFT_731650 [Acephala macrosclerotiorum]|nr:hypothetical protein BDZ45DRAFT_731650 [Acephala macrosclerotiorum]
MVIPKPNGPDISIAPRMLATCWTMYGIATTVIVLRLIAKWRINHSLGLDDGLMSLSLLLGIGNFSLDTSAVRFGLGRHFFYLTPSERVNSMKGEFLGQPIGILSPMFGRISFCVFLFKLIGPSKSRRWFLYGLMTQHIIINVLTIILVVVQCPNFATLWDPIGTPGKCWSPSVQADFGFFQGATNTVTDLILTTMPAMIVWKLQIEQKLKTGLSVLLGLSLFAMIASIIRTRLTAQIADRSDFTFNTVNFIIWCTVENCTVMVTSSVPMLRSLFVRQKPSTSSYEMQSDYPSRGATKGYGINSHIKSQITSRGYPDPDASEEDILPMQGNAAAIAKSTTYEVAYEVKGEAK